MSNVFHKNMTLDNVHAAVARVYADITARDADSDFNTATTNLNKMVRVDSPLAFYVLTAITPTWSEFTNVGGDEWTELADTPGSISAGLNVQGNSGGTALEFGQDLNIAGSPTFAAITIGASVPFADAAGVLTLQNVDAIDLTTEATIEAAIDTLVNLTSIQGQTISLSGSLTVEAAAILNQDMTTDADVVFGTLNLVGAVASTTLSLDSVLGAFRNTRMTTTQRDALTPLNGMQIFNTTTVQGEMYNGTSWIAMVSTGVNIIGTPVDNQVGIWASATGMEGDSNLTFDGLELALLGDLAVDTDTLFVDAANDKIGMGTLAPDHTLQVVGSFAAHKDIDYAVQGIFTQALGHWSYKTIPEANFWKAVAWSPELSLFCAVSSDGTNRVMTSPDGKTWTARSAAAASAWEDVVWSPEQAIFLAVASDGLEFGVMTSSDGISWTLSETTASDSWGGCTWSPALGLFVIVGADALETSGDGITWTDRTRPNTNTFNDVTWSTDLGLFCACSFAQVGGIITSPDGINWTSRNASANKNWTDVIWAAEIGLFVSSAVDPTTQGIQTSPDGITWILRTHPSQASEYMDYSPELGLLLCCGSNGVIFSTDGITWAKLPTDEDVLHTASAWSPDLGRFAVTKFVASDLEAVFLSSRIIDESLTDPKVSSLSQTVFGSDAGLVCDIPIADGPTFTQYDRSPFGGDGTADTGVTITDTGGPFFGPGGDFDGSTDATIPIATANLIYGALARTVIIQAATDTIATGIDICWSYGNDAQFQGLFLGRNAAALNVGGFLDDFTIADFWEVGVPHEVALTYDGTTVTIFVDGEYLHSEARSWSTVENEAFIGQQISVPAESWDGQLANFKMYDRVLDPAEIRTSYLRQPLLNSTSIVKSNNFRVVNSANEPFTVSLLGADEVEVFEAADIDDLATAGVITVTNQLTLIMKSDTISTATRFVLSGGGSLVIEGNDYGGIPILTYSGTGTFVSGTGILIINSSLQLVSSSTGTFLAHIGGFVQLKECLFVGWDDLGTITHAQSVDIDKCSFGDWGAPLVIESCLSVLINTVGSFTWPTGVNLIEISDPRQTMATLTVNGVSGEIEATASFIRIDPDLLNSSSVVFLGNAFTGGGLFDTSGGVTGAFTAVTDFSIASTTIDSVSNSSGIARFNFTVGPTFFVGQEVVIVGFVTNTAYNVTGIVTVTGTGFFEIARIAFGTDEATGSFTSDRITLVSTAHGLSNLQTLTVDTTLATDYDGGATLFNVQTNDFQISKPFTSSLAGTWDTAGLDQSDPRVLAMSNPAIVDSHYIAMAFVNDNSTGQGTIVNNTFEDIVFGTLTSGSTIERWKLVDASNGTFEYTGLEPFSGYITFDFTADTSGEAAFRYKWLIDTGSGFVDLPDAVEALVDVKDTGDNASKTFPVACNTGDQIKPQITRNAGSVSITTSYASIYATQ